MHYAPWFRDQQPSLLSLCHAECHHTSCSLKIVETSGKSFLQMKGVLGMARSTKKEETRSHYTANIHKTTWHHPYSFVPFIHRQQRCRDVVLVYVCSVMTLWCSKPSLYPLHFWRNYFSTCINSCALIWYSNLPSIWDCPSCTWSSITRHKTVKIDLPIFYHDSYSSDNTPRSQLINYLVNYSIAGKIDKQL